MCLLVNIPARVLNFRSSDNKRRDSLKVEKHILISKNISVMICQIYDMLKLQYFGHLIQKTNSLEKTDSGKD